MQILHPGQFLSTPSARRATTDFSTFLMNGSIFLSTPSARRATTDRGNQLLRQQISIHALREEGDTLEIVYLTTREKFLSTPSARRATWPTA